MRLSRMIVFFLIAVFVSQCVYYYPNLPPEMASHFNASGEPDGFMSKQSFFIFEALILAFIVLQFAFLPFLAGRLPNRMINMPNKEFWFSAERRGETVRVIGSYFEWFSAALLALFIGINHLAFRANLNGENLSSSSWLILGAFFIFVIVWLIKFNGRFKIENL